VSLEWFDRCLHDGEPLANRNPPLPGVRLQLRDAWWGKAEALTALGRYPDAIAAWDHAIVLAEPDQVIYMKLFRLSTLARTGEYDKALIELDPLAVQARATGASLFHTARVYALAARTAAADSKQPPPERDRRSGEAAERAIENLRLAQSKGYFADQAARDDLARNPDLDFLRDRDDFRKLLAELGVSR